MKALFITLDVLTIILFVYFLSITSSCSEAQGGSSLFSAVNVVEEANSQSVYYLRDSRTNLCWVVVDPPRWTTEKYVYAVSCETLNKVYPVKVEKPECK